MNDNKRILWINLARGIGIILVILGHMPLIPENVHIWIYSYHMPLFFVLSGFLYKKRNIIDYMKKSFKHCVVPYIIYSLIFLLIDFIIFGYNTELKKSINSFLIGQGSFEILWFFISLFIIENVYNIINNLFDNKKYSMYYILITISVFGYILCIFKIGILFKISTSLVSVLFYMMGTIFKKLYVKKGNIEKKILKIIFFLIINICCLSLNVMLGYDYLDINSQSYGILPLTITSALAGCYVIILFSMIFENNILAKPLLYIGENSKYFFPLTAYIPIRIIDLLENINIISNIYIKITSKIMGIILVYAIVELLNILKNNKFVKKLDFLS